MFFSPFITSTRLHPSWPSSRPSLFTKYPPRIGPKVGQHIDRASRTLVAPESDSLLQHSRICNRWLSSHNTQGWNVCRCSLTLFQIILIGGAPSAANLPLF